MSQVAPSRFTVFCALAPSTDEPKVAEAASAVVEAETPLAAAAAGAAKVAEAVGPGFLVNVVAVVVGSHYDALHAFAPGTHLGTVYIDRCSIGAYG